MIWAVVALVPPVMFVTGALIWWKRVVRPSQETRERDLEGRVRAVIFLTPVSRSVKAEQRDP